MRHLGARVTALVDGELPAAEAQEALAHAVACPTCGQLLEREHALRRAVSQATDAVPDAELTQRLLALPWGPAEPVRRRRRRGPVLAGAGVLAGAAVVGLVVVGGLSEQHTDPQALLGAVSGRPGDNPAGLLERNMDAERSEDVVAWMDAEGWSAPGSLPAGVRVVKVALHATDDGEVLEMEIAGQHAHVRMLQQRGMLAPETVAGMQAQTVGSHNAVVLPTGGQLALQSEDRVVVVTAGADDGALSEEILGALPAGGYDTSLPGRLVRGWQAVTQWALD